MLLKMFGERATCPACRTSLAWRGLRHSREYDLSGRRWYQYVRANRCCPSCGVRLENGPLLNRVVFLVVVVHLVYVLLGQPELQEHFGRRSMQGLAVHLLFLASELAVVWFGRCCAGFRQPAVAGGDAAQRDSGQT